MGCGLLGGLYFAFSAFIMTSLGRIERAAGIAAMNAINVDIVKSLFMPVFLLTTLSAAALAVLAIVRWGEPGALVMLAGGIVYGLGMFVVTMAFNVPLNNTLAAVDPIGERKPLRPGRATSWTGPGGTMCGRSRPRRRPLLFIAAIAA